MIGDIVKVTVDRPMGSFHPEHKDIYYPVNYGYIEGIIAPDGEEQDAYILGVQEPVKEFVGKIIAVIHRQDDIEEKWVVAPENVNFTAEEIMEQVNFQEQYFKSEIEMSEKNFYHGSDIAGIRQLEVRSRLHNSDEKVVYLTDKIPYALIYIWDKEHNGCRRKHVTAWIKDGVTFYEEQFPDQLKTYYQGVAGTLYIVSDNSTIKPMEKRDNLFYCTQNVPVAQEEYIADVYERLLECERAGEFKVLRYLEQTEERQKELVELVAEGIRRAGFYENDEEQKAFMKRHFAKSWELAERKREAENPVV